jgi:hypothetical protein
MSNIVIDIAAEFTGNKAFKQAESATDKLGKQAKKLAAAFGLGLSATAVLAYGKAAVKAAVADEKAQKQLALALKNVGLGRDAAASEAYIQKLQSEFGIVDDLLRPAYQTLAVATRDSAESQRLLNLALDISASTGKDLGSVTAALSKAYLGNNTSLSKLGVGISKADLKTKSFLEVTDELAKTFAGAATESANSLAGQMAKLEVASANVQEILGKGIIDSLIILSGNTSVDELAKDMETAATNAAAFLATLSEVVKTLNAPLMAVSGSLADFIEKTSPFVNLIIEGDPSGFMKKKPRPFTTPMTISGQSQSSTQLTKEQARVAKETLKISKDQLKLAKAKAIFDIQKIQIEAALKGKISEEERIRLMLLKAIAEENIDDIDKYTKMLNEVQGKVEGLKTILEETYAMDAGNPFISWEIGLDGVQRALIEINDQSIALTSSIAQNSLAMGLLGGASFAQALSGARYAAQAAASMGITGTISGIPTVTPAPITPTTTVNVIVEGTVTSSEDLQKAIQDAVSNAGISGNQVIFGTPERQVAI